ncbi:MAG: hypothetical protein ACE5DX_01100 [Candidatus Dojkabacteria bacterium]
MFFLFDERFAKLVQDQFGYDDYVIMQMRHEYLEMKMQVEIQQTILFLSENKLKEYDEELDKLSDTTLNQKEQAKNLEKFYKMMFKIRGKHPKLNDIIEKKLMKFENEMAADFFARMDDDALIQISDWFVDDYRMIGQLKKQYPELRKFKFKREKKLPE